MKIENYNEYYIQGSDHYLIPKDVFKELFNEMINWKEENKELKSILKGTTHCYDAEEHRQLKKQLEENKNPLKGIFAQVNDDMLLRNCGAMQSEIDDYKVQQQEFINWLKAMSKMYEKEYKDIDIAEHYNCVLQKYKKIIGGKDGQ